MTVNDAIRRIIARHHTFTHADVERTVGRSLSRQSVSRAARSCGCEGTVGSVGGYHKDARPGDQEEGLCDPEYVELQLVFWPGRVCSACRTELPANTDYFAPDTNRRSGLTPWCRRCRRKRAAARYRERKAAAR